MKRFYMILAALLIGSVCFAQKVDLSITKVNVPASGADRSAWVGSQAIDGLASTNLEYAMAPKHFDENISGNITKVKFYHAIDATNQVTNTSYTIKIYDNVNLTPIMTGYSYYQESSCGTAAYTQDYTATEEGWQEVELNTPFAVPTTDFWVAIKPNNGSCALPVGGSASAVEGQGYMMYDLSQYMLGNVWVTPEMSDGLYTIAMAIYVDDGQAEVIASDFEAKLFGIEVQGQQVYLTSAPEQYTIGTSDDLVIYPFYANNGPSVATSGTLTATIKLGGTTFGEPVVMTYTTDGPCEMTGWESFYQSSSYAVTITAAQMDEMGLGNSFDVCYEVSYTGNDPVAANNSFCIPVTRTNAQSDIQAKLYTDANGTELGASVSISLTDNFTVYPAILNAGPDEAAGTVTIDLQINGNSILQGGPQSMSLASQPLPVNQPATIFQGDGSVTLTPDQMDQIMTSLGITNGTFEVCFIANYSGNDPNTANNTKCVTVTRSSDTPGPGTTQYTITVLANNDAFGTVTGGGTFDAGSQITISATANQGYEFVKWQEDGNTEATRTITVTGNATYTAIFQVIGAVDDETLAGISVYPNPASDMFTVANAEGATIVVVNSLGQVVAIIENAAENQTIDASNFANGTYFVKVNETIAKINVVK